MATKAPKNPHDKHRLTKRRLREWGYGYLFIAPWIIGVCIFFLYAAGRSIYFSFAPLFLVPVYNEPRLNAPEEETPRTISASEIEGAASFFGAYFAPRESVTENIFNVSSLFYDDNVAHAVIESIGFEGIPRTDYVPCVGRDCNIHDVPVEWIEYIPVSRHTPIRIWRTEELPPEVEPLFCRRGFAFVAD
jgi:hypothetical protein